MLVATWAVLLPLDALRMQALVLRGEVIAILTLAAGEDDFVARHFDNRVKGPGARAEKSKAVGRDDVAFPIRTPQSNLDLLTPRPCFSELTTGIEPVTSPLPRVCSTN
jgi:hypothetical protein